MSRRDVAALRPCNDPNQEREHWLSDAIVNPLCLLLSAALSAPSDSKVVIFSSNLGGGRDS